MGDVKFSSGKLLVGDCVKRMREMPDNSVDSIVTDPPYELGFMGKQWDASGIAYQVELWQQCLRVLKPGGHLLAFGGTRTYHRMACAIEDAGFEIRDSIHWLYGSGFPKSLNVGKAIDKRGGYPHLAAEIGAALKGAREQRGMTVGEADRMFCDGTTNWTWFEGRPRGQRAPTSDTFARIVAEWPELAGLADKVAEAEREVVGRSDDLYGRKSGIANGTKGHTTVGGTVAEAYDVTAPATDEAKQWEGWGTALKPAHEPVVVARKPLSGTVAGNVLTHGTGGLNIDSCRVGGRDGRWPANIVFDGAAGAALDQQQENASRYFTQADWGPEDWPFVYQAKPSKAERDAGLGALDEQEVVQYQTGNGASGKPSSLSEGRDTKRRNTHPTVKPVALMRHLVRLVTPPGGTVLDPFLGSGTTAVAAILEGFNWIGCEMTDDYLPIIKGRVEWAEKQAAEAAEAARQLTLLETPGQQQ